jgi:hypothetical protein
MNHGARTMRLGLIFLSASALEARVGRVRGSCRRWLSFARSRESRTFIERRRGTAQSRVINLWPIVSGPFTCLNPRPPAALPSSHVHPISHARIRNRCAFLSSCAEATDALARPGVWLIFSEMTRASRYGRRQVANKRCLCPRTFLWTLLFYSSSTRLTSGEVCQEITPVPTKLIQIRRRWYFYLTANIK